MARQDHGQFINQARLRLWQNAGPVMAVTVARDDSAAKKQVVLKSEMQALFAVKNENLISNRKRLKALHAEEITNHAQAELARNSLTALLNNLCDTDLRERDRQRITNLIDRIGSFASNPTLQQQRQSSVLAADAIRRSAGKPAEQQPLLANQPSKQASKSAPVTPADRLVVADGRSRSASAPSREARSANSSLFASCRRGDRECLIDPSLVCGLNDGDYAGSDKNFFRHHPAIVMPVQLGTSTRPKQIKVIEDDDEPADQSCCGCFAIFAKK